MRPRRRARRRILGLLLALLTSAGCTAHVDTATRSPAAAAGPAGYDLTAHGIPRFVGTSYIDLAGIDAVSRFRSAEGHSYTDGAETCRSMKHYFRPKAAVDAAAIPIVAPVAGTVAFTRADRWGLQVGIRPDAQPAFVLILFHVNPSTVLTDGTRLREGQALGTHIGAQTWSDVAVGVDTPQGYRLVSWFEVITDSLFARFHDRGLAARAAAIISRAERDADPLTCGAQEAFTSRGSLAGWVQLK